MSRNPVLVTTLCVALVIGLSHVAYYHPQLPERVAIHFNAQGEPDGFASRNVHSLLMVGLQLGMAGLLVGTGFLVRVMPISMVNVPNRDYWLAPERKSESVARISRNMIGLAIGTQLFLVGMNHISTLINLGIPAMGWFWPLLGAYLVFVTGFCWWMNRSFQLPSDAART